MVATQGYPVYNTRARTNRFDERARFDPENTKRSDDQYGLC